MAFGRHLNIPIVGIATSSPLDWFYEPLGINFDTAVMTGLWSGYSLPMDFWQRLGNTMYHYWVMARYYYYIRQQDEIIEKYFGPGYPSASELLKDLDLLLVNEHYSLDGIKSMTPSMVPVGGLDIFDDGTKLSSVSNFKLNVFFYFMQLHPISHIIIHQKILWF